MIFLFKPKTVNVDLFTARKEVIDFAPIDYSRKFIPDWWKDLPKQNLEEIEKLKTMRTCVGVTDLFQQGFIIPIWSDIVIDVGAKGTTEGSYQYADNLSIAEFHAAQQRGYFAPEMEYMHIKLQTPWAAKTKESINWMLVDAQYQQDDLRNYSLSIGLMNFKYQHSLNLNALFFRQEEKKRILLKHGKPVAQLIPLTEKPVRITRHLVDQKEYDNFFTLQKPIAFQASYYKQKQITEAKECPYKESKA
jgi:hypothetical protein